MERSFGGSLLRPRLQDYKNTRRRKAKKQRERKKYRTQYSYKYSSGKIRPEMRITCALRGRLFSAVYHGQFAGNVEVIARESVAKASINSSQAADGHPQKTVQQPVQ